MEIGDNDKEKKVNKPEFNAQAYKHAISMIESSGGKFMDNPNSSAAGKYHFLYELIKKDPDMKGVSKRDFMNNSDLQERIMDKALSGKLTGYVYGTDYAKKLKGEYNSKHDVTDLTALLHFLGPGNVRKYLKNPDTFVVPGEKNATAQEYVDRFRKHFDKYSIDNDPNKDVSISNNRTSQEKAQSKVQVDATSVSKPRQIVPPKRVNLKDNVIQNNEGLDFLNKFNDGGQMTGMTGADKLVTLFENGGSHEENPNGGIPQGVGANGKINLVEEKETKWDDYIFSNSFSLDGTYTGSDGNSSNIFEDGGELTDPEDTDKEKKTSESKKNANPVTFGPVPEDKPLEFTKSEMQTTAYGGMRKVSETFEVPDVRGRYMQDNFVSTEKSDDVNFDLAVRDDSAQEFLNRYNDPWTRDTMKKQTGLSDEDIDNMILRGLEAEKKIGGNVRGSKASFDPKDNVINMGEDHQHEGGVETHERVHSSNFDAAQGENLMNILGNPFQQETRSFMKKHSPETLRYLKKPHEAYGNFAEFREKLGLKPGEQIDEKELNKRIKAKKLNNENFIRVFDDSKVVKALNTIAYQSDNVSIDDYKLS